MSQQSIVLIWLCHALIHQHCFLQCHAAISIPASGGKIYWPGHLPSKIIIESHSNFNLYPVFYLKVCLCHIKHFRKKSDGSWASSLFLSNNGLHLLVCAKMVSSWVRKIVGIWKAHVSLGTLQGPAVWASFTAGIVVKYSVLSTDI